MTSAHADMSVRVTCVHASYVKRAVVCVVKDVSLAGRARRPSLPLSAVRPTRMPKKASSDSADASSRG